MACFVMAGGILGLARASASGPGWPIAAIVVGWILSLCTFVVAAVYFVRMVLRARGATRKVAVLFLSLLALPLHALFDRLGSAPASDGALIDSFHARRVELDQLSTSGWAHTTEWSEFTHITVSGSSKGYLYTEAPPAPLVESLDLCWLGWSWRPRPACRRIEGNWYLYLD